ncbi:MAG TPA: M14 family zinc carboxypeptidase [Actinomycetota bacterium]
MTRRPRALPAIAVLISLGAVLVPPFALAEPNVAFSSPNLEVVAHVPLNYDASGGRILGNRFYLTTTRDLRIFDITNPVEPELLGSLPLPQEPQFAEEDLDTNGEIALVESLGTLNVIDVRDPTAPAVIGRLEGVDFHTISCVLDCTYAYAAEGPIVDLRDPTTPALVGDWQEGNEIASSHDVTEVAPGLVVTSSRPILLLDARADPAHPVVRAGGRTEDGRFIHANRWPRGGQDRFVLVGGETTGPRCTTDSAGAFMVWDTAGHGTSGEFELLDEWRPTELLPTAGGWPYGQFCAHWFTEHPTFNDGGLVAMAWYEYGVRFLDVASDGQITEVGHLIQPGSVASAAYWVTDEILYVVDYFRGFDIIRFTGPLDGPETGFEQSGGASWTSHADELTFLAEVARRSPRVRITEIGRTLQDRPLQLVQIGHPHPRTMSEARAGPVQLHICTQHGNEPAGREACLQWIRDLAFTQDPVLLEQLAAQTTLFVPTVNPDGRAVNDRENSANTDINRDHLAVTSLEARAIGRVIRDWHPSIMLDHHEYGPGQPVLYDDDVLYLWPRNLNVDADLRELGETFSKEQLRPCLAGEGFTSDEYGLQAVGDTDVDQTAGDHDEGIARNTAGLRHTVGILVESKTTQRLEDPVEVEAAANMRRRVRSQEVTIRCTFDFMRSRGTEVYAATMRSRARKLSEGALRDQPVFFNGQDSDTTPRGSRDQPTSVADPPPCGYGLTPDEMQAVRDALVIHDIDVAAVSSGSLVSMAQVSEPVIPLLLDERGARHVVAATPLETCPVASPAGGGTKVRGARAQRGPLPATGIETVAWLGFVALLGAMLGVHALRAAR